MDVRLTFLIALGIIIVTFYYLEKEMGKEQIFWLYAVLGVLFGIASVYTVAKNMQSYDYYITFTVLFVFVAILYYEHGEPEVEGTKKAGEVKVIEEEKPRKKKRR
jgi:peptidoglycan/LPS O-acetylase OafA/YrhL